MKIISDIKQDRPCALVVLGGVEFRVPLRIGCDSWVTTHVAIDSDGAVYAYNCEAGEEPFIQNGGWDTHMQSRYESLYVVQFNDDDPHWTTLRVKV